MKRKFQTDAPRKRKKPNVNVREVKATVPNACGGVATLFEDGTVECSGNKKYGGDAGDKKRLLVDVEFIKASYGAFAAKKRDGSVLVWGIADYGGDAKSKQAELTDVESITSTCFAFAAKKRDASVVVWGRADWGGDAKSKQAELTDVESITSNWYAFAAKKRDGSVVVWGNAGWGGDAKSKQADLIDVQFVVGFQGAFAAQKRDGTVVCWGREKEFPKVKRKCIKKFQDMLKNDPGFSERCLESLTQKVVSLERKCTRLQDEAETQAAEFAKERLVLENAKKLAEEKVRQLEEAKKNAEEKAKILFTYRELSRMDRSKLIEIQKQSIEIQKHAAEILARDSTCDICRDRRKNTAHYPCGHQFCTVCSLNMPKCAVCRKEIVDRINLV